MSKHDTPITTLQRIIRNTNTKNTLTKTKVLESNEYFNLLQYLVLNTKDNNTLNYTQHTYNTKHNTKARIKYYITDNNNNIVNISHIIFLIYKKYIPILKLNVKHNYIIGDTHTQAEIYARLSNYIYHISKQQIRIHEITPFT